jgi:hypothetical protein
VRHERRQDDIREAEGLTMTACHFPESGSGHVVRLQRPPHLAGTGTVWRRPLTEPISKRGWPAEAASARQ